MNAADIRLQVITALKHNTAAADRVYASSDWPTAVEAYPALLVQTPMDVKSALGNGAPQFTTVTTVSISGRLTVEQAAANTGTSLVSPATLETLTRL